MADAESLSGNRAWFVDGRRPDHRMAITAHDERGVVVVSLWHGDTCAATVHLSAGETSRLIAALAAALADSAGGPALRLVVDGEADRA